MMFDRVTQFGFSQGIAPAAARIDNTPIVSSILDLQDKHAAAFITNIGTNTDVNATFTMLLEESAASNMAGANAVSDDDLILTEASASFTFASDGSIRKLGYRGAKRYIRATITPVGNDSGNIFVDGLWMWEGHQQPVAQPTT